MEATLENIDDALRDKIPELQRRCATPRIFEELGINALLDARNELLERIRQFEEIFNPE
jgi:hypothetical protein